MMHTQPALEVFWHTDPSLGDPDDDYTAAALKALGDEHATELVGTLVNRRPAAMRATQFAATLAALAIGRNGQPVPVGVGADHIGRAMGAVHPGAPQTAAPSPVEGRGLQLDTLRRADDESLTLLITTAFTDLDWLLAEHTELARRKLRAVVAMSDAQSAGPSAKLVWAPGDAANNTVDASAARRVFACLQTPAWRHVAFTVVSRWAVFDGGEVSPAFLDELAEVNAVAGWLRDRAAHSMNERWTNFNHGLVTGRTRASFVANHLAGHDPGRRADDPIFDLATGVPLYDAVAAIAAVEPHWFEPVIDQRAPNVRIIGVDRQESGVQDPEGLNARLKHLLKRGFEPDRIPRARCGSPT